MGSCDVKKYFFIMVCYGAMLSAQAAELSEILSSQSHMLQIVSYSVLPHLYNRLKQRYLNKQLINAVNTAQQNAVHNNNREIYRPEHWEVIKNTTRSRYSLCPSASWWINYFCCGTSNKTRYC